MVRLQVLSVIFGRKLNKYINIIIFNGYGIRTRATYSQKILNPSKIRKRGLWSSLESNR